MRVGVCRAPCEPVMRPKFGLLLARDGRRPWIERSTSRSTGEGPDRVVEGIERLEPEFEASWFR